MAASPGGEWRQSFGQPPGSGAPTAMVASSNGLSKAHTVPVAGANAVSALVLPHVPARTASAMEFTKWQAALANVLIMQNLSQVVEDGKPPTRSAVTELFPDESYEQTTERFQAAMRDYQQENTQLFFLIAPSLNLNGPWEQNDIETIQRDYAEGQLRDGNGILQWFISMHDITQPEKQMALRADLQKTKFTTEMSCLQMLKVMLDALSLWEKVGDNDRDDFVKLNSYYTLLLEKWPTQPAEKNVVRVRFRLAEKVFRSDPSLGNVQATITDLVDFAKGVGVPEIIKAAPGTILATGATRLSASDNDCTHCSLFGCKAKADIKKCPLMNKAVPIGTGTAFPRDAQVRYIEGGRAKLVEEPDLTTLKDVKFFVKPPDFPAGGKGGGRGGQPGGRGGAPYGRGGGRGGQVTSILSNASNVQEIFGDEGENAQDFDSWMDGIMNAGADVCNASQHVAAPLFGNMASFFSGSPDGDGESLSQQVYDEIARASAAAAEIAFTAGANQATPLASARTPNPALTPLPPVTPIVNTSLSELRAAKAAESGGGITSSKSASKKLKDDDDDKTSTELVTEAISKGLKQDRTLRAKATAKNQSTLWWLLKQIKALLIKLGVGNLTTWQIIAGR